MCFTRQDVINIEYFNYKESKTEKQVSRLIESFNKCKTIDILGIDYVVTKYDLNNYNCFIDECAKFELLRLNIVQEKDK